MREKLTEEEIQKKLVFLDAEFATAENGQNEPVSVVIKDYYGNSLMNTLVCPRHKIKNYGEKYHGLTEKDLIGKPDAKNVKKAIRRIVMNNILVGSDLSNDIRVLDIKIDEIAGIRDLGNAISVRKVIESSDSMIGLRTIAKGILEIDVQQGIHTAEEDVDTVLSVYKKMESVWEDHTGVGTLYEEDEIKFEEWNRRENAKARVPLPKIKLNRWGEEELKGARVPGPKSSKEIKKQFAEIGERYKDKEVKEVETESQNGKRVRWVDEQESNGCNKVQKVPTSQEPKIKERKDSVTWTQESGDMLEEEEEMITPESVAKDIERHSDNII